MCGGCRSSEAFAALGVTTIGFRVGRVVMALPYAAIFDTL